jgi:hypothetical protein
MTGEDQSLARSNKAMTRDLIIVIGVLIAGLILIVFVVWKGILKGTIITEDTVVSAANDISTYIDSLSTVSGGMQIYELPQEMNVSIKGNFVQLSTGSITILSEFSGKVKETSFAATEICIVKNTINGQGEISICSVGDSECCKPRIIK